MVTRVGCGVRRRHRDRPCRGGEGRDGGPLVRSNAPQNMHPLMGVLVSNPGRCMLALLRLHQCSIEHRTQSYL